MPKPPADFTPPDFAGQTKIMIVNEGNPVAMLVTNTGGQRNTGGMRMPNAEAALTWCRKNAAMLIYLPLATDRN